MKKEPKNPEQIVAEAEEKLRAIEKLRQCPEFMGFFMSLLEARRDRFDGEALRTQGLELHEREVRRRIGREYDDLLKVLETEAVWARRAIETAASVRRF